SARGREIKAIKDDITALKDEILERLNPTQTVKVPPEETYVSTSADVRKEIEQVEKEKQDAFYKYNNNYQNALTKLAMDEKLPDDDIMRLEELTKTSFTDSASNLKNAKLDAEVNFNKAMRVIEKERGGEKSVNLKGDIPQGTGIGSPTKVTGKEPVMPTLDKDAQDYLDRLKRNDPDKWKDERVIKTIGGEKPLK
ncbi:MAG: hypothetical protein ACYS1A_18880, partial [Planctomycetota bacterium]